MPEMHFSIKWPNGVRQRCYSPSYVVEEHLEDGATYPVADFLARVSRALGEASERVRARYGFTCTAALDQLGALHEEARALTTEQRAGVVQVLGFEKHDARDARAPAPERRPKGDA